jgi:dCMP deaminase
MKSNTKKHNTLLACECEDGIVFTTKTKETVIHAEQNAVFFAAKNGININGATAYITHAPCLQCAKALVSSGIVRVVYEKWYMDSTGLIFLRECEIELEQYAESL